jgi:type IV pilus assembly protein PilB
MNGLEQISLTVDLQQLITTDQAWNYGVVPKAAHNGTIELYADEEKFNSSFRDELEMILDKKVEFAKTPSAIVQKALSTYYRKNTQATNTSSRLNGTRSDDTLLSLISEAKNLGSSDIHIEVYEEKCRVRIRIDGHLIERYTLNSNEYPSLINRIKIKASLDIAQKRLPQDGRIFFNTDGHKFDIRVSVLPTLHGEKVVLRLLSNDATNIDIRKLGFTETELAYYTEGVRRPHGILLISGPTGSGKTTTLYATLKVLNKESVNILTIEDPIEYTLEGINQVQLKESIGLTFASALRTFLRQDPDVIMLGEIRDAETAEMAIRAALTGHLVLSTIHTNSAWGTVSRLLDMGIPPFLLASTLNTTVAQRLVRLLCPHCKIVEKFEATLYPRNYKAPRLVHEHSVHKGCAECHYTGYKGRKAIYEVIPVDADLSAMIKNNTLDISEQLKLKKVRTLVDNAFELFANGSTGIDEVYPILLNN